MLSTSPGCTRNSNVPQALKFVRPWVVKRCVLLVVAVELACDSRRDLINSPAWNAIWAAKWRAVVAVVCPALYIAALEAVGVVSTEYGYEYGSGASERTREGANTPCAYGTNHRVLATTRTALEKFRVN